MQSTEKKTPAKRTRAKTTLTSAKDKGKKPTKKITLSYEALQKLAHSKETFTNSGTVKTPKICLLPGHTEGAYRRGLGWTCYNEALKSIAKGFITWEMLENAVPPLAEPQARKGGMIDREAVQKLLLGANKDLVIVEKKTKK